jgi:PAS domain S-box-containing protein
MTVSQKITGAVTGVLLLSVGIWAAAKYGAVGALFSTKFMAHRYCYLLDPRLVWTNAVSDTLIWLSYIAIAVGLAVLLRKTRTLLAFRWVFVAFGLFIVACGFTHFFEVVTLWDPLYWLSTSVKLLTAAASIATAIAFAPLVPHAAEAIRLFQEAYSESEQARAETLSKLLDTEERMKLAVESAGLATWERNLTTKELNWDERCRSIFGISDNRILRYEDFLCRVHPEDRAHTEALMEAALADHREYNAGFRVVRDDGEIRSVISRGKAFCDGEGQPIRFIGTLIDVTRERHAEEALVRAEKLAVAGRMAASIAHEINNPLDAAMGLVYVSLNDGGVPQHIKEQLKLVQNELHRAALITRSTLTFYRESRNPVPTDVVDLIESVLAFQEPNIRKAGVEVRKELICSQPVCAFPGELRQIFTNLICNAIDAMRTNGKLVVRVHPANDLYSQRAGCRIVIADSGPGIPHQIRKKLFEPFFTTKGEKGTGLGLWIANQLVQKHGGRIKLRSRCSGPEREGGTVFVVWLPLTPEFTDDGSYGRDQVNRSSALDGISG